MNWNNKLNKRYTLISIYVIVTAIIIYCLSLVAKSAPFIFSEIMERLGWLTKVSKPIVIGFVIAYLLDPVVDFLEARFLKIKIRNKQLKSGRTLAVLTTVFLIIIFVSAIISILVFSVTNQLRVANFNDIVILANTYINSVTDFYNSVITKLDELNIEYSEVTEYVKNAVSTLFNSLQVVGISLVSSINNISSYITVFIFSFIIGIYFMIDGDMIIAYVKKVGRALLPSKWNEKAAGFLSDADSVFSGYIRGQLTDACVMMILISLSLSIVGVKFAIVIGILAGIGNLVPYCGPFIAYLSTILVCLVNGQYKQLIAALIVLFVVQFIDGNIIAPKLLSRSIQIHPVIVVISLIFGNAIGGLLGMLLAVPVGALIKLLFVRFIDNRLVRQEEEKQEEKLKEEKTERRK